jgi:hypothetical protein
MHCNNILDPEQFVFRKVISIEDVAYKLTDHVLKPVTKECM